VAGGHWKSAKLLLSNGGPTTVEHSEAQRAELDRVDLIEVRREIKAVKVWE
jgi:hypothetical protein